MVQLISVLATAAAFSTAVAVSNSSTSSSGFVTSDKNLAFALNIPNDAGSSDLYFTLTGSSSSSWIAVGMGGSHMANALIFMAYADSTGKNVTVSPRLASNHVEPTYTSNVSVAVLPGSGIVNGTMTVNAMCNNCRSWRGGSVDPKNTAAQFIFAIGPDGDLDTNSLSANTKRHEEYGSFTMDLTKALGPAGVPISVAADSPGTTQISLKAEFDYPAALHACIMTFAFVGLMPFGVLILRVLNSPKWHGINQAMSFVLALVGAGTGIVAATRYNRTKKFNSAHQLFGIVIIAALVAQFVFGFMHHRIYKRTLTPTRLAPIHIWLGRIIIPCGIANGFLGFPLALNPKYNWVLVALILLVIIVMGPFSFCIWKRNNQKKNKALAVAGLGYQAQPWRSGGSESDVNLVQMNRPRPTQNRHAAF